MAKVLVTGSSGFVGSYMVEHFKNTDVELIVTSRTVTNQNTVRLDLNDKESVIEVLRENKPTHIVNLAGQSSVGLSWKHKQTTFEVNMLGIMNLLDVVLEYIPDCRILSVGSSEEYGLVNLGDCPIPETNVLNPLSPYGLSKLSAGYLCMQYARSYGINVFHTRTFNHIGVGQNLGFVTQDFAKQIADIEKGDQEPIINVGNLEAIRDFTDVRDIVEAYELLLFNAEGGEIYNVCSGKGLRIIEILNILISKSKADINIVQSTDKMRPADVPILIGDNSKLISTTNWNVKHTIENSLEEILNYYREK
ncbi:GDP-mannose 4,6-dehydratase [Paenibacillus radicis (ex Xue et al. 2023)]|uniref:GDP-mannose 4,6-dehydratase n=1 Tax=Paenibacillus radicis (ex Xue et al. 2023) TaxID=2972489 RepID=A0ABT1YS15_9BACL|nr:GDP-mannose 4,6-dehydratase [Paenibacillus radicis (ex Xue et al. 2023)]MCR8635973.1 GDP-mannose 4,6-dehydratase [Paenibacillus radicis (ex Xue et al. 2023)]